ncbi:MAG TPA: tRNA (5-methylaminomethyl-2-thiouridylate)-methyltransferase [Candidatus Paceibacterota bacterium]|nr:tRNA (5-methylaminomethyl-2-thiouridylate)-methyltransferase [Candidatus Paceibacterota bacterium]
MNHETRIVQAISLIRYPYAIVFILAGLDKIFSTNFIVTWAVYVSPFVTEIIGVSHITLFLICMGVAEIVAGALLFTKWSRYAAYAGIIWFALISINLVLLGTYDIAIRDILLAFALGALSVLL